MHVLTQPSELLRGTCMYAYTHAHTRAHTRRRVPVYSDIYTQTCARSGTTQTPHKHLLSVHCVSCLIWLE